MGKVEIEKSTNLMIREIAGILTEMCKYLFFRQPSVYQLAHIELKYDLFIHFGLNTFRIIDLGNKRRLQDVLAECGKKGDSEEFYREAE